MFCEKFHFHSLFSSESWVFPVGILYVLKMYHIRLFIVEKMGFETASRLCEIHSKPQPLLQKICISYASETLTAYAKMCLGTHAPAYAGHDPST